MVVFIQKVQFVIFKSPDLKKKIFQITTLSLKFGFVAYCYRREISISG